MAKTTNKVILARVTKGAEYLDGFMPKWATKINIEQFDIASNERCILGQLGKTSLVDEAMKKIKLKPSYEACVEYGFMCDYDPVDVRYGRNGKPASDRKLEIAHQKYWLDAINSRLEKTTEKPVSVLPAFMKPHKKETPAPKKKSVDKLTKVSPSKKKTKTGDPVAKSIRARVNASR